MLYKFHRLNHFLYQLIIDNKLWFSKPSEFNDPFDMRFISDLKSTEKDREEGIENLINQLYNPDFRFDKQIVKETFKKRASEIDLDKLMNENILKEFQQWGVCCFANNYQDLLLWSHYTDGHRGVCLEFDFFEDNQIDGWLWKVQYSSDFPHIKTKDEVIKGITTKSPCWEYEQEYRIVLPVNGLNSFNKKSLQGIIFGAKTEESEIIRVTKLVKQSEYGNVTFRKACINKSKYELEFTVIN